ncbi:peptidoglycan-binding protein [Bacillaceae bacterium IKA-2]|nr:peptidoglycan-binding protein [Bacillaceae bacterium IKA-2]
MQRTESSKLKKATVTASIATSIGLFLLSPQATEAALGDQTLQPGMQHQDVKELQDLLKQKGYFTFHTSTGYYGDITKAAVEKFQQAEKLTKTGIVDKNTLQAVVQLKKTNLTTLRIGSRGQAITELQDDLRVLGMFNRSSTGYFGSITDTSVREFQLKHGIRITGIADQETLQGIKRIKANGSQPTPQKTSTSRSASPTQVVLKIGSRGASVSEIQSLLKEANLFDYHTITGYYGEITATGVRHFQRLANLPLNGQADAKTVEALKDHLKKVTKEPTPTTTPTPTSPATQVPTKQAETSFLLKVGISSEAVRELQHQLNYLGYFNHRITGYFGPITEASVKEFQKKNSLIADGLVTTSTMNKLVEEATSKRLAPVVLPSETNQEFNAINLVADASQLLGTPYVWGGTTSAGMDCSGFIQNVFQKSKIQLPRTVAQMWNVGQTVSKPKVGDLVFFETYTKGPSHAGIYIGNNQFIHSGASTGVTVSNLTTNYWSSRYLGSKSYK